jgi:cell wall-associated NlpC family hydrolase
MIAPSVVIDCARSLVGTPYRHQGRTRSAVDCIGLLVVVAVELKLFDPAYLIPANYSPRPVDGLLEKHVLEVCELTDEPLPGGIALFRWARQAPPAHCAVLGDGTILHAYKTVGHVVEHGLRGKWPARVHSFYRLPGVSYP